MKNSRKVITAALGAGLGALLPEVTLAQSDPRNVRPQAGCDDFKK